MAGLSGAVRVVAAATCVVLFSACGSLGAASGSPTPTLSRIVTPTDPSLLVKTAGRVLAVLSSQMVKVQIDPRNQGTQVVYDNAVILLRSSDKTVFVWATLGQSVNGPSASSMSDLKAGETITFSFEPRTEDPADHSFLTFVVGRTPP